MDGSRDGFGKALRGVALVLVGLSVTFTLLGGLGTTCVAFGAERYGSMVGLVPYKPLYQVLVVVSLLVGVIGVPVTFALARGRSQAFRNSLLVLIVGGVTAGIQVAVSQSVRGSAAPANIRLYVTVLTLAVLLLLRLTPVWRRVGFSSASQEGDAGSGSAGVALALCGLVTLSTHIWVGYTHQAVDGGSWVSVLGALLSGTGWGMFLVGLIIVGLGALRERVRTGEVIDAYIGDNLGRVRPAARR